MAPVVTCFSMRVATPSTDLLAFLMCFFAWRTPSLRADGADVEDSTDADADPDTADAATRARITKIIARFIIIICTRDLYLQGVRAVKVKQHVWLKKIYIREVWRKLLSLTLPGS